MGAGVTPTLPTQALRTPCRISISTVCIDQQHCTKAFILYHRNRKRDISIPDHLAGLDKSQTEDHLGKEGRSGDEEGVKYYCSACEHKLLSSSRRDLVARDLVHKTGGAPLRCCNRIKLASK